MPNILVFGAGGVGCFYTYVLSRARDTSITTVCRGNHDAIRDRGITLHSTIFGNDLHVQPNGVARSCDSQQAPGPWDYIVVTAKALPGIVEQIRPAVGETTCIVLLQNGIGIEEEYARLYPSTPIVSGVVYLPVTQIEPGVVRHGEVERLELGAYPADSHVARLKTLEFTELIQHGGGTAESHEDVQARRWTKLLVNASWNPICALTRLRDAHFLHSSRTTADGDDDKDFGATSFVRSVMAEVVRVASAAGYGETVTEATVEWQIDRAKRRTMDTAIEPSMLADAKNHRRLEVEAIVGNTVRKARDLGVPTPRLDVIYMLTRALDRAIEQQIS